MRKLVLYSNQLLPQSAEIDRRLLAPIAKPKPRIGYIPSCSDPTRKYYTFYFLHWLYASDLLMPLREYVERGGVLIGVSAGAILMTPNISSGILCGDVPPVEIMTEETALGLVDFSFVPHITEETDLRPIQGFSLQHHTTVYACSDEAGIVVNGEQIECIGDVIIGREGQLQQR